MGTYVPMEFLSPAVRAEACRLRQVEGRSLGEIAKTLGISQSTARRWTLEIELTADQRAVIDARRVTAALRGSALMAEGWRERRRGWQQEGRDRAREGDLLHHAGCMLYWAEGT